eukprot:9015398-Pyramimonas_sp.AAC.1
MFLGWTKSAHCGAAGWLGHALPGGAESSVRFLEATYSVCSSNCLPALRCGLQLIRLPPALIRRVLGAREWRSQVSQAALGAR